MNTLRNWIMSFSLFVIVIVTVAYNAIQFDRKCAGYLDRASNANTITLAERELNIALSYIEANNLTQGNTAVLYSTPSQDIGYWYENLKTAHEELVVLKGQELDKLTESNQLIKLRETLTDHSDGGKTEVIHPMFISLYPNNTGFFIAFIVSLLIPSVLAYFVWREENNYYFGYGRKKK